MIDFTLQLRAGLAARGRTPLRRALADALRQAIADAHLAAGSGLPASRVLAQELGIGRNSVLQVYEQLASEGWLLADRQGTLVASLGAAPLPQALGEPSPLPELARRAAAWGDATDDAEAPRPFLPGVPALDEFPLERWRRRVAQAWRTVSPTALAGRDVGGEAVLRAAIAAHLHAARGVGCSPDQVVVTRGTQESLALCAQLMADPGERAWVEHPGYLGAITALASAGLKLIPVPVDAFGMAPTPGMWRRSPPRLIYTTPSHQFPLGVALSLQRRLALLDQARAAGAWILEDDYDSEFCRGVPMAAMQGLQPDAPVVYLGTFSKTLYPALRLAYMVLPRAAVDRVLPALARRLPPGRSAEQEALAAFLHAGEFAAHLRRMRRLYGQRHEALRGALARVWPVPLQLSPGEGGMHLSLALPTHVPDREVVALARAKGLEPRALSTHGVGRGPAFNGLVLGYANVPVAHVDRLAGLLAQAVAAVAGRPGTQETRAI
jgi:GntR family transcriptional regulator/MocR family aminotransferase